MRLRDVNRAAGDYAKAVELYGETNLETSRRLGRWQELRAAYERQTGRPLYQSNPPGARTIGAQVMQIKYRHAGDGKYYRHDFERAGTRLTAQPDGSLRIANPTARLWGDYGDMRYLENPPRKGRKRGKRGKGKGRAKAARRGAGRNPPARKRATKRKPPAGFRSWAEWAKSMQDKRSQGGTMARRKGRRRASSHRARSSGGSHRRRRSYRRNPPGRGLVGFGMQAVTDGAGVTAGVIAARAIPAVANLPQAGAVGLAVQLGAGLGAGILASRMVNRRFGENMAAGAMSAVYQSLIKRAGVPVISSALGDEGDVFSAYPNVGISAYPQFAQLPGMGAYPQSGATGVPAYFDQQQ